MMKNLSAWDQLLAEGEANGIRKVLLRQGGKKFGAPDESTRAVLSAIEDEERLERMAEAILAASSWAEVLAVP